MRKIKNNRKGMTLISMMIMMALGSLTVGAVMTIFYDSFRIRRSAERTTVPMDLKEDINRLFENPAACMNTFSTLSNMSMPYLSQTASMRDASNNVAYAVGGTPTWYNEIKINQWDAMMGGRLNDTVPAYPATYLLRIRIYFEKSQSDMGSSYNREVHIIATYSAAGTMSSCQSRSQNGIPTEYWTRVGNDIFSKGVVDNVGIGVSSPQAKLHLSGPAFVDNSQFFVSSTSSTWPTFPAGIQAYIEGNANIDGRLGINSMAWGNGNVVQGNGVLAGGSMTLNNGRLMSGNNMITNRIVVGQSSFSTASNLEVHGTGVVEGSVAISGTVGVPPTAPTHKLEVTGQGFINGNVGIGLTPGGGHRLSTLWGNSETTHPVGINMNPAETLDINGDLRATGTVFALTYVDTSDQKLKEHIEDLQDSSKVLKLIGRHFLWKTNLQPDIGFVAQEVEKIYPEFVSNIKKDGKSYKGVAYDRIIAPVTHQILVQNDQIQSLRDRFERIKNRLK